MKVNFKILYLVSYHVITYNLLTGDNYTVCSKSIQEEKCIFLCSKLIFFNSDFYIVICNITHI